MESAYGQVSSAAAGRWLDRADVPARPTSVREALRALGAVTARLCDEGDARAAFPDIYAIITRRVAESVELGQDTFFWEPRWISRLAGRFCERYLETLRWSFERRPQDTGAWGITYEACDSKGTLPLQHVLLGLSAHINFDLALGIYRTIVEFGAANDPAAIRRFKHDHDAVNDLLRASIPEAFDHLINVHRCEGARVLFHRAYALSEWCAMRILASWRERVWHDAMALLAASAAERDAIIRRMERRSCRYARLLSIPGLFPVPLHTAARRAPRVDVGVLSALL
jgi:hypothetical protein